MASSFSSSEIGAIIVLQPLEVQGQFVFKLQRDVGNDKYYTNENSCVENQLLLVNDHGKSPYENSAHVSFLTSVKFLNYFL